jgi:hypothetical protein
MMSVSTACHMTARTCSFERDQGLPEAVAENNEVPGRQHRLSVAAFEPLHGVEHLECGSDGTHCIVDEQTSHNELD